MWQDLRFALRTLLKTPAFTFVAVLALALGLGAASTIFSAVNALLLRPLPSIKDQDGLVYLSEYFDRLPGQDAGISYPDYLDWRKQVTSTDIAASEIATVVLAGGERPDRYLGTLISAHAFTMLGVEPILGRNFRPEEDSAQAEPVVLLSYDLWQCRFAGDKAIVGKSVVLNGAPTTVVGVMPKGWRFPETTDLWMPLRLDVKEHKRGSYFLSGFGRLKPGATIARAQTELDEVAAASARTYPETNSGLHVRVQALREDSVQKFRSPILLIMGAVMLVHLIACGNVANLLLARGATRAREIAIRAALGATRGRIIRQLLFESLILGLLGAGGGLLIAVWGVDWMVSSIPVEIPYWVRFDFDWRVFAFVGLVGLLSSVVSGLFPALQASRPNLVEALKEGGRSLHTGPRGQRVRSMLVIAEVAIALVLLMGAGLMLRSFIKLQQTDLGVDPANTLTFRVGLPPAQYPNTEVARKFFSELMPKLASIPGVESAGATSYLPAAGNMGVNAIALEGEPEPRHLENARLARACAVTPGYFPTMRIPLLEGRPLAGTDTQSAPLVAVLDEAAAKAFFPKVSPLGKRIRSVEPHETTIKWATVVGVVHDVIYDRLALRDSLPCIYFSADQMPESFLSVVLRTKSHPAAYTELARAAVLSVNKDIPIYRIFTMDQIVEQSYWERRFFGSLLVNLAGVALFLASLGIYGVMTYSVRQRTQEIGVRMALGAQGGDVLRMVAGHGMQLVLSGLAIGMVGSYFLTRLLAGNLHGISAHDPLSFTVVPLLLFFVGLISCYLPARRATRVDPMEALRYQ